MCKGPLGAAIKIRDDDAQALEYWHIDSNLLADGIALGATVEQGQVLGSLRPGTWTDTACGPQYTGQSADNAHLHWVLPKDHPFNVEGWAITYPTSSFNKDGQTKTCNGGCWNSQIFFASSNGLNGNPTSTPVPTPTPTPSRTPTATPQPKLLLWVAPSYALVKVGGLMTLTIGLSHTHNSVINALQFDLTYSPTLLNVQAIAPGDLLSGTNPVFTPTLHNISNTLGLASIHISRTNAISPSDGGLLIISAQAITTGLAAMQPASVHITTTTNSTETADIQPAVFSILDELPSPRVYLPMLMREFDGAKPTPTSTLTSIPTAALSPHPFSNTNTDTAINIDAYADKQAHSNNHTNRNAVSNAIGNADIVSNPNVVHRRHIGAQRPSHRSAICPNFATIVTFAGCNAAGIATRLD